VVGGNGAIDPLNFELQEICLFVGKFSAKNTKFRAENALFGGYLGATLKF